MHTHTRLSAYPRPRPCTPTRAEYHTHAETPMPNPTHTLAHAQTPMPKPKPNPQAQTQAHTRLKRVHGGATRQWASAVQRDAEYDAALGRFHTLVKQLSGYYLSLIELMQRRYNLALPEATDSAPETAQEFVSAPQRRQADAVRQVAHQCYLYLGDLGTHRRSLLAITCMHACMHNDSDPQPARYCPWPARRNSARYYENGVIATSGSRNFGVAHQYYMQALRMRPTDGPPPSRLCTPGRCSSRPLTRASPQRFPRHPALPPLPQRFPHHPALPRASSRILRHPALPNASRCQATPTTSSPCWRRTTMTP